MGSGAFLFTALIGATGGYFIYAANGQRLWRSVGNVATLAALVALSTGLVTRGVRGGHWPFTNRFEFALCTAWAILTFHLLIQRSMAKSASGAFVLPLALLLIVWAAKQPDADQLIRPLTPALQTHWFPLHVGCSAVAYGAFAVAGGLGMMVLVSEWLRRRGVIGVDDTTRFPSSEQTEYYVWRAVGLGFPWLTLAMLSGAIWAQVAWGRYWDWDPKESWTLVTWLLYLVMLHGRALQGWRGRRVAWLAVAGIAAVGFTFLGVGWLVRMLRLESAHIF